MGYKKFYNQIAFKMLRVLCISRRMTGHLSRRLQKKFARVIDMIYTAIELNMQMAKM